MGSVYISSLGSGSSGNSIYIRSGGDGLLVDAGFSLKETLSRLSAIGEAPENIKALLITHEHGDHSRGARVLADKLGIATYTTESTARFMAQKNLLGGKRVLFDSGSPFQINDFNVHPFSVPHDAVDPVGFVISIGEMRIGIAMDLGVVDRLSRCRMRGCDALMLESNYDLALLRNSSRPPRLIHRIVGRNGHLSNEAALEALSDLLTERTRHLLFGHVSSDCNDYDLVRRNAIARLQQMGRSDIAFALMRQDEPIAPILL